jgi:beta-glucosidase
VFSSTDPLFPFGFGLGYTRFEYSDLKIEEAGLTETDTIKLSAKVKNSGDFKGKEVIQVYINDNVSSVATPVKALKAFCKTELDPGEVKTILLSIPCHELGLWNQDMKYAIEPGDFEIMIGASSGDTRIREFVSIK